MKFGLDFNISIGESFIDLTTLLTKIDSYREQLGGDPSAIEAALVLTVDNRKECADYVEPALRLADQWLRKLVWVVGGDTETVAYRNSEHCFALVPAGDSVEVSFFVGSQAEIEEYVLDPFTVRLDVFANASIAAGDRLLALLKKIAPDAVDTNEDAREFVSSLDELRSTWKAHQLHNRRT